MVNTTALLKIKNFMVEKATELDNLPLGIELDVSLNRGGSVTLIKKPKRVRRDTEAIRKCISNTKYQEFSAVRLEDARTKLKELVSRGLVQNEEIR